MNASRIALALGALAVLAACGEPAGPAADKAAPPTQVDETGATVYGSPLATAQTLTVADVTARAAELDGKPVRVEGTVVGVCSMRGCWIRVADDSCPTELLVKVEDGTMVFPMSAKGKWAVADGTVRRSELTMDETCARAAEEAKAAGKPFDASCVTKPGETVRLDGIGVRIRDKK